MTQMQPSRIELAEHKRNVFRVKPEAGTPFEVLKNPGFWAHVSVKLSAGDLIEVFPDDRAYFGELIVLSADKLEAHVAVLRYKPLQDAANDIRDQFAGEYRVSWMGPIMQWGVMRGSDTLKHGLLKDVAIKEMRKLAGVKEPKGEKGEKDEEQKAA